MSTESKIRITDISVVEYINEHYRPRTEFLKNLRADAEAEGVPIILRETENILSPVLLCARPRRILEIGTAVGYSAIYFAEITGGSVVTCEKDEERYCIAERNFIASGLKDKIKGLLGDGEDCIESLKADGAEKFDMIFIDGPKSHYKRFLEAALPLLEKNALIVCDNVLFKGRTCMHADEVDKKYRTNTRKMKEFVEYIHEDKRFDTYLLSGGDGVTISFYRGEDEEN